MGDRKVAHERLLKEVGRILPEPRSKKSESIANDLILFGKNRGLKASEIKLLAKTLGKLHDYLTELTNSPGGASQQKDG